MWGGRGEGSRLWGRRFQRQSEGEERDIVDRDNKQFVMDWALLLTLKFNCLFYDMMGKEG